MRRSLKILTLLIGSLVSIISANSMETAEKNKIKDTPMKIDINELPATQAKIMLKRKMEGTTALEKDTFKAIDDFQKESEKINTSHFDKELKEEGCQ